MSVTKDRKSSQIGGSKCISSNRDTEVTAIRTSGGREASRGAMQDKSLSIYYLSIDKQVF